MTPRLKWIAIGAVALAAVALGYRILGAGGQRLELDQSSFYDAVLEGRVEQVDIAGDGTGYEIRGKLGPDPGTPGGGSARNFSAYVLQDDRLSKLLREQGVAVKADPPRRGSIASMLAPWILMLLVLGVVFFYMRPSRSGPGNVFALRRSRARLSSPATKASFKDVAGVEEAKQELQEIVEFLREPEKFQRLGGKIPTGVLLTGPTGTGKTLLARAVAGEADVPFFSISGSDFVEMFVGLGASRVRDLFERGRKNAPCIIFIDEIDAVGRQRGAGVGGGHDEREHTLNQLLVALDGFEPNEGVIVLAATNRPDVLDPALLRPGRFDRQIVVDRPDRRGREEIIRIHVRKVPLAPGVDLGLIARGTPGFSGADLANLVNEAALFAARRNREAVTRDDLEQAKDKVLMGPERRSLVLGEVERRAAAYHEAGHALLAHVLPEADPVHKATIIPRGRALGTTQQLPADDRHTMSEPYLLATISVLLAGRAAEEKMLDRVTSGAEDDLERTTGLARRMVKEWGMSESVGPLGYGRQKEQIFLGREIAQHRDYSEGTAGEIDREVKRIVMDCQAGARRILDERVPALTRIAEALLERETLDALQIAALVRGEALPATPATSEDLEERLLAAREGEGAGDARKNAARVGDGLPLIPEPDARPA